MYKGLLYFTLLSLTAQVSYARLPEANAPNTIKNYYGQLRAKCLASQAPKRICASIDDPSQFSGALEDCIKIATPLLGEGAIMFCTHHLTQKAPSQPIDESGQNYTDEQSGNMSL